MNSPYTFSDHWSRIQEVLDGQPKTPTEVSRLCGLGVMTTQLALRMALKHGLCKAHRRDTYQSNRPGSRRWQQSLYFL